MINRYCSLVALAVATAALAMPASVFAHPSVYTDPTGRIDTNPAPGAYTLAPQTRHVVTNHGFTLVLRESNETSEKGVMDYSRLPGDYRAAITPSEVLDEGDTGAQAHATCRDVPELEAEVAIRGWQGTDPFYNYVPFQKAAAGLEDDPALWIEDVLAITGVNLAQVSDDPVQAALDLEALCEAPAVGGTFVPADQTQTTTASLNSGYIHEVTDPLNAQIADLDSQVTALEADVAAAQQATANAQAQLAAANGRVGASTATQQENERLKAEIARLKLEATALKLEPVGTQSAAQLAAAGASVKVTGPAGRSVTIKISVSKSTAKALGLKSRVLGSATAKIGTDASVLVKITPGARAKSALKKAKRSIKLSFNAVAGDRSATATR